MGEYKKIEQISTDNDNTDSKLVDGSTDKRLVGLISVDATDDELKEFVNLVHQKMAEYDQ